MNLRLKIKSLPNLSSNNLNYVIKYLIIINAMYFIFKGLKDIFIILLVDMGQKGVWVIKIINIIKQ